MPGQTLKTAGTQPGREYIWLLSRIPIRVSPNHCNQDVSWGVLLGPAVGGQKEGILTHVPSDPLLP